MKLFENLIALFLDFRKLYILGQISSEINHVDKSIL